MKTEILRNCPISLLVAFGCVATATFARAQTPSPLGVNQAVDTSGVKIYSALPLLFEARPALTDIHVSYVARGSGYAVHVCPSKAIISINSLAARNDPPFPARALFARGNFRTAVIGLQLVGSNPNPDIVATEQSSASLNEFIGKEPALWRRNVPGFAQVKQRSVYPGIDFVLHGTLRQLEYDFIVAPQAEPGNIQLRFEGVQQIRLDNEGALLLETAAGELRQPLPLAYQEIDGKRKVIECCYALRGEHEAGFVLADYDRSQPLVIDPVLTFLGINVDCGGVAVDDAGNAYLTGVTSSMDFPIASGFDTGLNGGPGLLNALDAFVMKVNTSATGFVSLVYATYLGGSGNDIPSGIALRFPGAPVGRGPDVYIAGATDSTNFPLVNPFQTNLNTGALSPSSDVFIAKLSPDNLALNQLQYSTYLGGGGDDSAGGIAVDQSGRIYVAGATRSINFPVKNAFDSTLNVVNTPLAFSLDAFVTELDPSLAGTAQLLYSTFLGGNGDDLAAGVALDPAGNVYVAGLTESFDFPTRDALDPVLNNSAEIGPVDAFVAKLVPTQIGNASLRYSTFLGGGNDDAAIAIAVDNAGIAYVVGVTDSRDLRIVNPFQTLLNGNGDTNGLDAFVAKINSSVFGADGLLYSSYLGGSNDDTGAGIALGTNGTAYVTGITLSPDFPMQNPFDSTLNLNNETTAFDSFVTKLATGISGSAGLLYSTFLGGRGNDTATGVAADSSGNVYVTGVTESPDFPTRLAFDQAINAGGETGPLDGFLSRLNPALSGNAQLVYSTYVGGRGNETCFSGAVILGFTPSQAEQGSTITIVGTGFTGATNVSFAAGGAATFTVQSDTRISATVPCGSTSGRISVATPSGTSSSADIFSVVVPAVSVSVLDAAASEAGADIGSLNIVRTGSAACPLTVRLQISGAASNGMDYIQVSNSITIPAGRSLQTIVITPIDDSTDENDETVTVSILTGTGYTVGAAGSGTVTILDNDAPPVLAINDNVIVEGNSGSANLTFTVTMSAPSEKPVTVNWATSSGSFSVGATTFSATAVSGLTCSGGADFITNAGSLTFLASPPGTTTPPAAQTLSVAVCGDLVDEDNETFFVRLLNPVNATLSGAGVGTATITDDDAPPTVTLNTTPVTEGDSGTVNAVFTVALSAPSQRTVSVDWITPTAFLSTTTPATPGTNCGPGIDYISGSSTLTFPPSPPGATAPPASQTINIPVCGDVLDENNEPFGLRISVPDDHATIAGNPVAVCIILDNDPTPTLSLNNPLVLEPDFSSRNAVFTLSLSQPSGRAINFSYNTSGTSARAGTVCGSGTDYLTRTGSGTIPIGATTATITVPVCGDLINETNETFQLNVSTSGNPISLLLGRATILDNDAGFSRGTFDLTPVESSVAVRKPLTFAYTWTVPSPLNWHDLESLELRIRDGADTIIWLRFDEATQTFSLLNGAKDEFKKAFAAGSSNSLQTATATLDLAGTTVKGSGPTGPSVTLNLALSFKPRAAGRTFIVEVAATNDGSTRSEFMQAGTLTVGPLSERDRIERLLSRQSAVAE